MQWRQFPFIRLGLPLFLGVAVAIDCSRHADPTLLVAAYAGVVLLLSILNQVRVGYAQRWIFGLVLNIALFLCAFCLGIVNHEVNWHNHFLEHLDVQNYFTGEVKEIKQIKKTRRIVLDVKRVMSKGSASVAARGRLLVYLPAADTLEEDLVVGQELTVYGWGRPIPGPKNPGGFDFRRFMHGQNVHYQIFVKPGEWRVMSSGKRRGGIRAMAAGAQAHLLKTLEKYLVTPDERAVGAALILGYRGYLERDLRDAYANTGAMHVLAVSGLHVGLVYLGLNLILGGISGRRRVVVIGRVVLLLAGIWLFAFITGASASVMRAATMLSFFVVGRAAGRHCNIYNILAASAFLLLCLDPLNLAQVGFQLSYAALLGIVYLQPKIYRLVFIRNPVLDHVWKLLALSVAAQLSTLPLSLYYFHQFPVYFWLSGIIVVPAATLILAAGLGALFFSFLPPVAALFGSVLYWLIRSVNLAIRTIQGLPGNLIDEIYFPAWLLVPIAIMLIGAIGLAERRKLRWAYPVLLPLLVVLSWSAWSEYCSWQRREAVIYHMPGGGVLDLFLGKTLYTYHYRRKKNGNAPYAADELRERRRPHRRVEIDTIYPLLHYGDKTILVAAQEVLNSLPDTLAADYIVLTGNPQARITDLLANCRPEYFIFDSSNSYRTVKRWQRECELAGQKCHNVYEEGAFVIEFSPPQIF